MFGGSFGHGFGALLGHVFTGFGDVLGKVSGKLFINRKKHIVIRNLYKTNTTLLSPVQIQAFTGGEQPL